MLELRRIISIGDSIVFSLSGRGDLGKGIVADIKDTMILVSTNKRKELIHPSSLIVVNKLIPTPFTE